MEEKRKRPASKAPQDGKSTRSGRSTQGSRSTRSTGRPSSGTARSQTRRRPRRKKTSRIRVLLDAIARYRAQKEEFRPDVQENMFLKSLHFTYQQRINLLRWVLLSVVCMTCLVLQDCVFSRLRLAGATTDLGVAAIILVAVMEGSEVGGIFALIASILYFYSGSAPGAYSVALIVFPSILCALFRQKFWRRGTGSNLLCSAIAMFVYEMGLYIVASFMGLTRWDRGMYFLRTAVYSIALMIPLYQLIYRIGLMGDHVWKD